MDKIRKSVPFGYVYLYGIYDKIEEIIEIKGELM